MADKAIGAYPVRDYAYDNDRFMVGRGATTLGINYAAFKANLNADTLLKNYGRENAGKILAVDADGRVVPTD